MSLPLGLGSFSPHCLGSSLRPCTAAHFIFCPESCDVLDGSVYSKLVLCHLLLPLLCDVSCPWTFVGQPRLSFRLAPGSSLGCLVQGLLHHGCKSGGPSAVETCTCTSEVQSVFCPLSSPAFLPCHSAQNCFPSLERPLALPLSARLSLPPSPRSHARNRPWKSSWPRACRTRRPRWTLCRGPCRRRRLCLKSGPSCWQNRRPWRGRSSSQLRRQLTSGTWGPTSRLCPHGLTLEEPGVRQGQALTQRL